MKRGWVLLVLVVVIGFSGVANADLTQIGTATYLGGDYKLIYDDDQDLVWLDYTKFNDTWQNQVNWPSGLGGSLTVNLDPMYTTTIDWSTGWRLPSTDESKANLYGPWGTDVGDGNGVGWGGPDQNGYHDYRWGYNMANSEMAHLYYVSLGNKGTIAKDGSPQSDWGLLNTSHFEHLQTDYYYWSGTEYSPATYAAWVFSFNDGYQAPDDKNDSTIALAVRPGEVSAVPIPGALWLLGSSLIGLAGFRRKFRKS